MAKLPLRSDQGWVEIRTTNGLVNVDVILHLTTIIRLIVTKHVRIGAHVSIAIHEKVVF